MGNCQAAEAATVVIQHPGSKIERIYWSVSAREVMASNPGHYVALVIPSPTVKTENGIPVRQLKLLRPDDTLHIGQVYRLISFQEVLKEFAAKKSVKLGKLLKETGRLENRRRHGGDSRSSSISISTPEKSSPAKVEQFVHRPSSSNSGAGPSRAMGRQHGGGGSQWRPALHSIAEVGS
ncbi:PREDICTED: uncharacterized protein LOC104609723 [Nelumbo nucifera]|uniref:DUF4228 domain-containing protein n=2 Tax=Nelumbo nucifera TaxID=4432 RepID=A0A822XM00_NELNU|nr:PREDICTED: uncharacterized protein LOC104609723 [Nelumbo nucifera]DAD21297.1 TPA_asm: hypothetical protein HUJ06_022760 [Nelumbo nucifera]